MTFWIERIIANRCLVENMDCSLRAISQDQVFDFDSIRTTFPNVTSRMLKASVNALYHEAFFVFGARQTRPDVRVPAERQTRSVDFDAGRQLYVLGDDEDGIPPGICDQLVELVCVLTCDDDFSSTALLQLSRLRRCSTKNSILCCFFLGSLNGSYQFSQLGQHVLSQTKPKPQQCTKDTLSSTSVQERSFCCLLAE